MLSKPISVPVLNTHFELTKNEQNLCALLLNVQGHLRSTRPNLPPITLRVAGGWVRDKILGKSSNDMDIALDTIMGFDFAVHAQNYVDAVLKKPEIFGRSGHVAKIKANPDKSKHLETACLKLFDIDVDFVNLRNEIYAAGSRVPKIEFGTALEDATRRDLTINSLFFNLNSLEIEDLLGTGLQDLKDGFIRTPLAPFETFRDDPLRILRSIRFASRFNYKIDPAILESARSNEIQKLLKTVVSKERVGEEVKKMMSSPKALDALRHILDFGIYRSVFAPPLESSASSDAKDATSLTVLENLETILADKPLLGVLTGPTELTDEQIVLLRLASCVYPLKDCPSIPSKKRSEPAAAHIIRHSLKLPNTWVGIVDTLTSPVLAELETHVQKSKTYLELQVDSAAHRTARKDIGLFLHTIGSTPCKSNYHLLLLFLAATKRDQVENIRHFMNVLDTYNLKSAHQEVPCINGTELVEYAETALGIKSATPGKWVGIVGAKILSDQFEFGFCQTHEAMRRRGFEAMKEMVANGQVEITNKRQKT